ncbi:MAG: 16S rRNA (cytosine(1402)-N(4))-methyltransferase RsmH [Bacteroidales bacterium]|jgi:16S rRNA (cytosine1402-N4)-methyltransferase|nr:16S rRNA (cytosine(1402)-N(4))-methyltransferase RsmH [Bacteroidales bacterium]
MGYHTPVLLKESIEGLKIKPNGNYVDVTFGGGGHSREIINHLNKGKLLAFDQDDDALLNLIDDKRFLFANHNFRFLKNFLKYNKIDKIDGLLADLGVSSHHFDKPKRGFSFRFDGELDMRMNQSAKLSAKNLVNEYEETKLAKIFWEYGELKNSRKLAKAIVDQRENKKIGTIKEFTDVLMPYLPKHAEHKFLAKVFQALRIEVNREMEFLKEMLLQTTDVLKPGGRLVVITYHSLEDRIVKNFIKKGKFKGEVEKDFFGNLNVPFKAVNRKIIVPSDSEIKVNNRARSAKLRIAERV